MIAIIPCAGKGTRRYPETRDKPKILLRHEGYPIIEHILCPICESNRFSKIVFVLNPQTGHQIMDYLRVHWIRHRSKNKPKVEFIWQNKPLGFGHAVLQAKRKVLPWYKWNERVLIHTDDAIISPHNGHPNRSRLIQSITRDKDSRLGTCYKSDVKNYGVAITEGDVVKSVLEKPDWLRDGLALTGMYYITNSRLMFRYLKRLCKTPNAKFKGEYQFTDVLQMMIDKGEHFWSYEQQWIDLGSNTFGGGERYFV